MKDDLANEDLAHLRALTEPKDDMLKRETPLPKASPVCPVCGIAVPHAHDYAGLMTLIVKQKNDLAAAQAVGRTAQMNSEELAVGPLGRLGARLAELLDDDQWNNIEPMLVTIKADQEDEIRKLQIALRIKTEEHDCCSEELVALRAKAELADEFLEEIKNNWSDWSPMNSPAEIIVDLINERNEKIDEREAIHAMCVCMAARLEDCAVLLEIQMGVCRTVGYLGGIRNLSETAAEARKLIKEWEGL